MSEIRLTHEEREILRPVLERYARWESAHDGPVFEAIEKIIENREAVVQENRLPKCVNCGEARHLHEHYSGSCQARGSGNTRYQEKSSY